MLDLGRLIVRQLEHEERCDLLTRWMAHHIAELIQQADTAIGPDRSVAMERARSAIMDLWSRRWQLQRIDPLADQRQALQALASLSPDGDPWRRGSGPEQQLMSHAIEALRIVVVGSALLIAKGSEPTLEREAVPFLDESETKVLEALAAWTALIEAEAARASRPWVSIIGGLDDLDSDPDAVAEVNPDDEVSSLASPPDTDEALVAGQEGRAAILKALERVSCTLNEIIQHHRSNLTRAFPTD